MKKILGALAATLIMTSAAQAAWPDKTVTMVVPFPPGGSTDLIGRLLASRLEAQLGQTRSEEHTSELQSLMRISYAVFCLKKKKKTNKLDKNITDIQKHNKTT